MHRFYRNGLRPYVYLAKSINSLSNKLRPKLKNLINFICYWLYSIVPKNKEVWVFLDLISARIWITQNIYMNGLLNIIRK